jgi:hypothetical protein
MAAKRRHKLRASVEPSPSADWKKLVEEWVWKLFGLRGIVVLAVILVAGGIWWMWEDVVKRPGITEMVKLANQPPFREVIPNGSRLQSPI